MNNIKTAVILQEINMELGYPVFEYAVERIVNSMNEVNAIVDGRKYTPNKGDKIYILPGCNIPRFKLKQFCKEYGTRVVKYEDSATVKFIGPEVTMNITSQYSGYKVEKNVFTRYLHKIIGTEDPRYIPFLKDIQDQESDFVYFSGWSVKTFFNDKKYFQLQLDRDDHKSVTEYTNYRRFNDEEAYQKFLSWCKDDMIRHQDDMLKVLNSGTIMDDEMFHSIKRLFESKDHENMKVGMETLANCDYEESAVPILLLLKEYGSAMSETREKNHVNFKSMLKFFKLTVGNLSYISLDTVIMSLQKRDLLTTSNVNRLLPLAGEQITNEARLNSFEVKKVDLKPEYKEVMKNDLSPADEVEIFDDESLFDDEINPFVEGAD